ncbi:hypothetical protein KIW84_064256 [Lathyrus oleraceus]|uniref:Uncharacterized protein n=1 Tax=Pisum sativum TaxID=3888 RepID=A0A9D4W9R9_PEA|nr:hypothetical protein KIW84_064256 [Pisum sativum]
MASQQPQQSPPEPEVNSPSAEQPNPTPSDLQPPEPNTSAEPQTLNLSLPTSPPPPSERQNTLPTLEEAIMLFAGASVDKVKSLTINSGISDDPSAVRTQWNRVIHWMTFEAFKLKSLSEQVRNDFIRDAEARLQERLAREAEEQARKEAEEKARQEELQRLKEAEAKALAEARRAEESASRGPPKRQSGVVVKAFDGSRKTVIGEVELPVKIGPSDFQITFQVMDIHPSYSCLLGRPWIHEAGAVTSTLHQKLKFVKNKKLVVVGGEKALLVSHLSSFSYIDAEDEVGTSFQALSIAEPSKKGTSSFASYNDQLNLIEEKRLTAMGCSGVFVTIRDIY